MSDWKHLQAFMVFVFGGAITLGLAYLTHLTPAKSMLEGMSGGLALFSLAATILLPVFIELSD